MPTIKSMSLDKKSRAAGEQNYSVLKIDGQYDQQFADEETKCPTRSSTNDIKTVVGDFDEAEIDDLNDDSRAKTQSYCCYLKTLQGRYKRHKFFVDGDILVMYRSSRTGEGKKSI